jgi:hypothetical protein
MGIPRQVVEAEEAVNEQYRQMEAEAAKAKVTPDAPPAVTLPAENVPPPEQAEQAQVPPPASAETSDEKIAKLEHQLSVLKGKLDKEVPRLAAEKRELKEQIRNLELQVTQVAEQKKTELPPPEANEDDALVAPEYLRIAERKAREMAQPLMDEIKSMKKSMLDSSFKTFESQVLENVPDFKSIDQSEPFETWLRDTDRDATLNKAFRDQDVARITKIYNAYKETLKATNIPPAAKPTNTALNRQVAPKPTNTAPVADKKETFKASDLTEWNKLLFSKRMTPAQHADLNRRFDIAYEAGNVDVNA